MARVRRRISRFTRSVRLFVRIRLQRSVGKSKSHSQGLPSSAVVLAHPGHEGSGPAPESTGPAYRSPGFQP